MPIQQGRPRLDSTENFKGAFASLLPGLREGTISKGEMARRLNISHRSLNRYLLELEVQRHHPGAKPGHRSR